MYSSDLESCFVNGIDVDVSKMNEMNMTDKQRALVMKLSEHRRKLTSIRAQMDQQRSKDDSEEETRGSRKVEALLHQLEKTQTEGEEIEHTLLTSLGHSDLDQGRKRRQELEEEFNVGLTESFIDEFTELTKKQRSNEYPDIPVLGSSENIDSIRYKLKLLNSLRYTILEEISSNESEKKLNEIAQDDDDVDPLDAFMAENTADLASEQISKAKRKLEAVDEAMSEFDKVEKLLSKNQFKDTNTAAALQQRHQQARELQPPSPRGKGTVWEDEFRKDESVPIAVGKSLEKKPQNSITNEARLNASVGGLQILGGVKPSSGQSASAIRSVPLVNAEKRQEELRKKLGY